MGKYAGTYELYGGNELVVAVAGSALMAHINGNGRIFFDRDRKYRLTAANNGLFIIESPARDVVRFDETAAVWSA